MRREPKFFTCTLCHTEFKGHPGSNLYCSKSCGQAGHAKNRRAYMKKNQGRWPHKGPPPLAFWPLPPVRAKIEQVRELLGADFVLSHLINDALGEKFGIPAFELDELKHYKDKMRRANNLFYRLDPLPEGYEESEGEER